MYQISKLISIVKLYSLSVAIRTFQNTDKIFTADTFRNLKPRQVPAQLSNISSVLTLPFDKTKILHT